mgnify:CR=1 FL=1
MSPFVWFIWFCHPVKRTGKDKISQYFSYQIVSRVVTGIRIGNEVQINEIQSVCFSLIHKYLYNKERL